MTPPDVVVTGLGAITPAGLDVENNWATVTAGRATAATTRTRDGVELMSCSVPGFDAAAVMGASMAWRTDRFVQLAVGATRQAIADARLDPGNWDGARVAVVLGNSLGGSTTFERQHAALLAGGPADVSPLLVPMSMVNMVAGNVSMDCGARGPSMVVATACASGTTAIGLARELLRAGACDVALAGGTESALSPVVLAGLSRMGALSQRAADPAAASCPFDARRDGFVPAEGAAVLVLERSVDATARGAVIRARLAGFGASADSHHITAPAPDGAGLERALRAALADAALTGADIDHVNAHGTSTPLNDVTEAAALSRVVGHTAVTSTKGVTGHTLAAAGAIEAVYTVRALEEGLVPPTANLVDLDPDVHLDVVAGMARRVRLRAAASTSLGFGGHNAAVVLTAA